jgi:nucleotide-binding universal stress UspA family protein
VYKNVLLTVDLNDEASWTKALPTAVEQVRAFDATLHVLSVVPDFGMPVVGGFFPVDFEDKALVDVEEKLNAFCAENVPEGIKVEHSVRYGKIYNEIIDAAKNLSADLIVIGVHRTELTDYLLGPNAARVVRHADCSVLVVRE